MRSVFEFRDVCYKYPGRDDEFALQGFSTTIPAGGKVAVVGRNGSGKSTFFLHCNGLYQPLSGQVLFDGEPLTYHRKAIHRLRQQVGLVFQNPDDQLFNASVTQDISFGPLNLGLREDEVRRRVRQVAQACDIIHLLGRPTHALSGGEKARVALAGVLAMEPEVLLADEPMTSLDPWARLAIFDIFQRFYDQGKTILMATHNLSVVRYWASYVVVLQSGQAVFEGTPQELLTNHAVLESTGLSRVWWKVDPAFPKDIDEVV